MTAEPSFLELQGVRKEYPGVLAVDDVSLTFEAGEVVGLVGKNGAGKSTLIKMMAGAVAPDVGTMHLDGEAIELDHPHQATELGLAFVHQDLYDVADLSVAENVMLGLGFPKRLGLFVDWRELYERAAAQIRRLEHRHGAAQHRRSQPLALRHVRERVQRVDRAAASRGRARGASRSRRAGRATCAGRA